MKKLLFSAFLATGFLFVISEVKAQVQFGAKAGMNISSIALPLNGYGPKIGYQFGILAEMKLSPHLSIQPALLLSSKGVTYKAELHDLSGLYIKTIRTKQSLDYLELPLLGLYKRPLKNGAKLYAGLGPYMGVGLFSNTRIIGYDKQEPGFFDESDRETFPFDRLDIGVSGAVGVEVGRFVFGINFNRGIKPLAKDTNNHNNTLGLTVGYFFIE